MSSSTVTDKRGAVWRVRDIGGGVEEHTLVSGPTDVIRMGGSCGIVDRPALRSTSAASPARARSSAAAPRVDHAVLKASARDQIIQELAQWDAGWSDESRETGGHLIGRLDGSTLVVTAAFGPGPEAVRAYGMLRLDLGYTESVLHACQDGERIIGLWHSHPVPAGPSRSDLVHFAGEARWFSEHNLSFASPLYLGLIATRAGADWAYPVFDAYLSRGDDFRADPIELEVQRWRE